MRWLVLVASLFVGLAQHQPAQAVDDVEKAGIAATAASFILPQTSEILTPVVGIHRVEWWVDNRLVAYCDEAWGRSMDIPNIGGMRVIPHWPTEGGKGIRRAWVTESTFATLRQDKQDSKRVRSRLDKGELAPEFENMDKDEIGWYFTRDLRDVTVGQHLYRCAADVEEGKERTSRVPLFFFAKFGSYAAREGESYVVINVRGCTFANGALRPEFADPRSPDGINYDAVFAAFPNLIPVDAHVPVAPRREPRRVQVTQTGTQAQTSPTVTDQKTDHAESVDGKPAVADKAATAVAPARTGSNQWVKIVNMTSASATFIISWPNNTAMDAQTLEAGKSLEFEIPQGLESGKTFQVFLVQDGKANALPNKEGKPDYLVPTLGGGTFVNIRSGSTPTTTASK